MALRKRKASKEGKLGRAEERMEKGESEGRGREQKSQGYR
ncbi:hypothetical protein LEMLEM_LOCUS10078, partial [Lemmus lemmus]